ncbi:kinesin-domain-containing protein [Polychaeton citri CBS 116435]|uniref:Kinesin-domain-containing protein n=1 Tax=Polychaeton citri CBS 116435 TaxID=1314669 RepID=A0A9P4UNQ2_9PEZI|nr:kinesin-domain-containing protein [Polychaeton citri CBS 116435]
MASTAALDRSSSINVTVRVRPFTIREAAQLAKSDEAPLFLGDGSLAGVPSAPKLGAKGIRNVIKVMDDKCLVFDPPEDSPVQRFSRSLMPSGRRTKDQTFAFDRVFDENTTQGDVYEATTRNLLDSVLDGYNATVFAYGATGCGKTHTITGTSQQPGIIFLTMQELFEKVDDVQGEKESEVTLSYLEIYNETIRDLLSPGAGGKQGLMLREDANQTVSVAGLSSHNPQNVQEVMDMVIRGNSARTQSPTEANATSSRSHAVLQINVSLKDRNASTNEPVTMATLSIIDLAGSERASATKNRGERLLEGANINKSLLALGSCINALCDPRKKNHVPYRNSKLTRLLKFSLGGNCRTVMIVCVSPSSQHFDETQNTLRYANRAKNIQTKSVRNVYNVDRHVKDYLKKIDEQMNRINELTRMQKDFEEIAFGKFRKTEQKKREIAQEGLQRIRVAYEHSRSEREERTQNMRRLRQVEKRIGAISGWIGAFDQICDVRSEEEAPKSLTAMRKTAQGILVELEGSRQHLHQRLSKNNWSRAVDTALHDGVRNLQALEGMVADSSEEVGLAKECELLKGRAELDMHIAVLEQEKSSESALQNILIAAHFETIAILNQIFTMSEADAVQAARDILGKLLKSCAEAVSQVIKPDGSLRIEDAVPSARKRKQRSSVLGPSPMKAKIRSSIVGVGPSALPPHIQEEVAEATDSAPVQPSSPLRLGSPKRKVKLGVARKMAAGTPRKKSPTKKRAVRWRDDDGEGGSLVEFQKTPEPVRFSPIKQTESPLHTGEASMDNVAPQDEDQLNSSPISAAPIPKSVGLSEVRRAGPGRFATGFLQKSRQSGSVSPPPSESTGVENLPKTDVSPLREIQVNAAHQDSDITRVKRQMSPAAEGENSQISNISNDSGSETDHSFTANKETAAQISGAIKMRRTSSVGGNAANRQRARDSLAHRRRSPSTSRSSLRASTSPPPESGMFTASHARRMVGSQKSEDPLKSVLSPRTAPISKGPVAVRRSMLEGNTGTPKDAIPISRTARVSSVIPGAEKGRAKAVWR